MEMQYNRIKKSDRTLQWNSRRIIFVWEIIIIPKDILDPKLVDWIIAKVIKIDCKTAPWRQLISMNWNILQGWCISVKQIWYETTKGQILSIKERVEWLSIFLKRNRRASEESIHLHSIYASLRTHSCCNCCGTSYSSSGDEISQEISNFSTALHTDFRNSWQNDKSKFISFPCSKIRKVLCQFLLVGFVSYEVGMSTEILRQAQYISIPNSGTGSRGFSMT